MHEISYWAKAHQRSAQFLILMSHILLAGLALFLGKWLDYEGVSLSKSYQYVAIFVATIGLVLYPFRFLYDKKEKSAYFQAKKQMDTLLILGGFLLFLFIGNHSAEYAFPFSFPAAFAASPNPNLLMGGVPTALLASPAPSFFLKIKELHIAIKILLLLLTLVAAYFAGVFILVAGCSISCAGFGTASSIFMVGGILFFLAGIFMAIHHIFGKKPVSPKGLRLRKILGITALVGLAALAATMMFYITVSMGVSVAAPMILVLLMIGAAHYVSQQFKKKAE